MLQNLKSVKCKLLCEKNKKLIQIKKQNQRSEKKIKILTFFIFIQKKNWAISTLNQSKAKANGNKGYTERNTGDSYH